MHGLFGGDSEIESMRHGTNSANSHAKLEGTRTHINSATFKLTSYSAEDNFYYMSKRLE